MRYALVIFLIVVSLSAYAQAPMDPNHAVYRDVSAWAARGIIPEPPYLRPYPAQLLREILLTVVESGAEADALRAQAYLSEVAPQYALGVGVGHSARVSGSQYFGQTELTGRGAVNPVPWVSLGAAYDLLLVDDEHGLLLPSGTRKVTDWVEDRTVFDAFDRNFRVLQGMQSSAAVGSSRLYAQAGIMRSSYGPFFDDGLVLSPTAPSAGHLSFTWLAPRFELQALLLELTATDDVGGGRYPDKRMVMRSYVWQPAEWVRLSLYESIVFGGRVDYRYFLPIVLMHYAQGMGGFSDNSLIGLSVDVTPVRSLRIPVSIYMDDMGFNEIVRLELATAKLKLALQSGVYWYPDAELVSRLFVDYLLVTPYMYSHRDRGSRANHQNYTHVGTNLGPALSPNSDRLTLRAELRPFAGLEGGLLARYMRHGNASDGVTDGDGSIFDDGYDEHGRPTFERDTRFLTQSVIEKTLQLGVDLSYEMPLSFGVLEARGAYVFEQVWNAGLQEGVKRPSSYLALALRYRF